MLMMHNLRNRPINALSYAILVALLYFVAARIGLAFQVQPAGVASIWPPSGLLLAALVLRPRSQWPVILGAVFLAITLANLAGGNPLGASLGFGLANCTESLLAAWLLVYFVGTPLPLTSLRQVLGLTLVAVLCSNGLTGLLGAAVAALAFGSPFWETWRIWVISDGLGMLLVGSTILTWATGNFSDIPRSPSRLIELVGVFAALVAVAVFIFNAAPTSDMMSQSYLTFPLLIWSALRFGPHGAASASLLLAAVAVWFTAAGLGPFATLNTNVEISLLEVQAFLLVAGLTALTVAAITAERNQTEAALQQLNDTLEQRVAKRTAELTAANQQLQAEFAERMRTHQALRQSEERFRQMAEISSVGLVIGGPDNILSYMNPSIRQLLGYTEAEVQAGQVRWDMLTPPEFAPRDAEAIAQLKATGTCVPYEKAYIARDGRHVPILVGASVLERTAQGEAIVAAFVTDLTVLKQTEQALRTSEASLRLALTSAQMGTWDLDLHTQLVQRSESTDQLFGISADETTTTIETYMQRVHPDDHARVAEAIRQTVEEDAEHAVEYRIVLPDGTCRWVTSRGEVVRDANGQALRMRGALMDITARKQIEDERAQLLLREQAARQQAAETLALLDTLLAQAPIGVAFLDTDLRFQRINEQLAAINGLPVEAHLGRRGPEITPGLDATVTPLVRRVLETGEPITNLEISGEMHPHPSTLRHWLVSYYPVRMGNNGIMGVGLIVTEITERKRAEQELARLYAAEQQARAAAETAVQIRDQFLSLASHELKTPLTVLLGNAQILQRRVARQHVLEERDRRNLTVIVEQATRLNKLIGMLLDISRIETGQFTLNCTSFDLGVLIRKLVEEMHPTLTRHTLDVTLPEQPLMVVGDELRLEQVIQNLVGNAVKYSPRGGTIMLAVTAEAQVVRVTVTDEGIGIPAEALPQLFQRFYRATNTQTYHIVGLGIGLFVAKEIVERHGGTITVASQEGIGSSFTISLPDASSSPTDNGVHGD